MPTADTLILCIGNPSRGDDAAGALAATALAGRLAALPALAAGVSVIEDFQLHYAIQTLRRTVAPTALAARRN